MNFYIFLLIQKMACDCSRNTDHFENDKYYMNVTNELLFMQSMFSDQIHVNGIVRFK